MLSEIVMGRLGYDGVRSQLIVARRWSVAGDPDEATPVDEVASRIGLHWAREMRYPGWTDRFLRQSLDLDLSGVEREHRSLTAANAYVFSRGTSSKAHALLETGWSEEPSIRIERASVRSDFLGRAGRHAEAVTIMQQAARESLRFDDEPGAHAARHADLARMAVRATGAAGRRQRTRLERVAAGALDDAKAFLDLDWRANHSVTWRLAAAEHAALVGNEDMAQVHVDEADTVVRLKGFGRSPLELTKARIDTYQR
jgi:hypothetical protein